MCGPSSALSQAYTSTPSSRTLPADEGHSPTSTRASVVLPAADGPTTASTSPGVRAKFTPRKSGAAWPGALTTSGSTVKAPRGAGSAMAGGRGGTVASRPSSRPQAPRTFTTVCHCDTTCTSGASIRPPRIEPTIIMPPPPASLSCSSSQQPSPSSSDPSVVCKNLPSA